MENKYFTPDIEDIRIGYKCEVFTNKEIERFDKGEWKQYSVDINTIETILKSNNIEKIIRVPYLTKEQIEAEGWVREDNYLDKIKKQRFGHHPDYTLKTNFGSLKLYINNLEKLYENIDIERYTESDPTKPWSLSGKWFVYRGSCKDINTFRYICKLINIK